MFFPSVKRVIKKTDIPSLWKGCLFPYGNESVHQDHVLNIVAPTPVLEQIDGVDVPGGNVQKERAESFIRRIDPQPGGIQGLDSQHGRHRGKIGVGVEKLIVPGHDAPERGGLLVPQVAVDHPAVAHDNVQRSAVIGQVAHAEAGRPARGWAADVGDLQQIQPGGGSDYGGSGEVVCLEGHGSLDIDTAIVAGDRYRLIAGADPAITGNCSVAQPVDKSAVSNPDPEGGIAVGRIQKPCCGCAWLSDRPSAWVDGSALTRVGQGDNWLRRGVVSGVDGPALTGVGQGDNRFHRNVVSGVDGPPGTYFRQGNDRF